MAPIPRSTQAAPSEVDTKDRILDAAERLFHERGFSGTSLRAVTTEAGVNLAAVHYHLGSKEALLAAVIERRAAPLNAERLLRLEALLRENPKRPAVEAIVAAFLAPAMDPGYAREIRDVSTLMFREPVEFAMPMASRIFAEIIERFVTALVLALPHLEPDEVAERFHYMLSVMVQVASGRVELGLRAFRPEATDTSPASLLPSVTAFVVGGLRAPASRGAGSAS